MSSQLFSFPNFFRGHQSSFTSSSDSVNSKGSSMLCTPMSLLRPTADIPPTTPYCISKKKDSDGNQLTDYPFPLLSTKNESLDDNQLTDVPKSDCSCVSSLSFRTAVSTSTSISNRTPIPSFSQNVCDELPDVSYSKINIHTQLTEPTSFFNPPTTEIDNGFEPLHNSSIGQLDHLSVPPYPLNVDVPLVHTPHTFSSQSSVVSSCSISSSSTKSAQKTVFHVLPVMIHQKWFWIHMTSMFGEL